MEKGSYASLINRLRKNIIWLCVQLSYPFIRFYIKATPISVRVVVPARIKIVGIMHMACSNTLIGSFAGAQTWHKNTEWCFQLLLSRQIGR